MNTWVAFGLVLLFHFQFYLSYNCLLGLCPIQRVWEVWVYMHSIYICLFLPLFWILLVVLIILLFIDVQFLYFLVFHIGWDDQVSAKCVYLSLWLLFVLFWEFFTPELPDGYSLEFGWKQVSSGLQDISQYSGRSQKSSSLNGLYSSYYFQVFQSLY